MRPHNPTLSTTLAVITLLAIVIRLVVAAAWHSQHGGSLVFGDSETYWVLARAIATGGEYRVGDAAIFRTPGYPLLLAPILALEPLFSSSTLVFLARCQNAVLGGLVVLAAAGLAHAVTGSRRAAIITSIIVAIEPLQIAHSALILTETPFTLAMTLGLWSLVALTRTDKLTLIALTTGVLAGVAVLIRPSWLIFAAATPIFAAMLVRPRGVRTTLHVMSLSMLALAISLAPWTLRNAVVCGHFVPTTLQMGASLYDGLNPNATGASDMAFVEKFSTVLPPHTARDTEWQLDRTMRDAAIQWASEHPWRVAELAVVKLARLWNPVPNEPSLRRFPINVVIPLANIPIFIIAIWGAVLTWRCGWAWRLMLAPAVYVTLLHVVFVASLRYRSPVMVPLAVLAAVLLTQWLTQLPAAGNGGILVHQSTNQPEQLSKGTSDAV